MGLYERMNGKPPTDDINLSLRPWQAEMLHDIMVEVSDPRWRDYTMFSVDLADQDRCLAAEIEERLANTIYPERQIPDVFISVDGDPVCRH